MILLVSATALISLVTASAVQMDVHASFVDVSGTTITPSTQNTRPSTATTTTVVASPAVSTQRNLKTLTVRNTDAALSNAVTVQHNDGTTTVTLCKVTLLAGDLLMYNEMDGFFVLDSGGGKKIAPAAGRLLKTTVLTAGVTFTTGVGTGNLVVRMVGGGGGGAGCTSVAAAASAGGGGGAGGYAEKLFAVTPNTNYTYAVGAAGTGASGALGGNGTSSTFTVGGTTVTAFFGTGAPVATALTTVSAYAGGTGGAVSTSGDLNSSGQPGDPGMTILVATPIVASGNGGSSPFGAGGKGITAVGNGNNAIGFGGGGGGAATGASAVRTGGNGSAGVIIVDEYS